MSTRELFARLGRAGATYMVVGQEVRVFVPHWDASSIGNVVAGHWVCFPLGAGCVIGEDLDELGTALGKGVES